MRKKRAAPAITAFEILNSIVGEPPALPITLKKNPAAVAQGRLDGLKGGKARRRQIAKKAAQARWLKNY